MTIVLSYLVLNRSLGKMSHYGGDRDVLKSFLTIGQVKEYSF